MEDTFRKRERGYEAKFKLDEEMRSHCQSDNSYRFAITWAPTAIQLETYESHKIPNVNHECRFSLEGLSLPWMPSDTGQHVHAPVRSHSPLRRRPIWRVKGRAGYTENQGLPYPRS